MKGWLYRNIFGKEKSLLQLPQQKKKINISLDKDGLRCSPAWASGTLAKLYDAD